MKSSAHVDFNDINLDNIRFMKLNSYPARSEHATAEYSVDQSLDEPNLVRKSKIDDFNNYSLSNTSQITLNLEPTDDNHVATKSFVDSLSEKDRIRRDTSTVFKAQYSEFDIIKLTNLDSNTVKRNATSDNQLSNKNSVDF